MKISLVDKSKYYKGLLVLIGRDRIIDQREHALMIQLGTMFDFDKRFCEAAIADLLDNKYITDEPIIFEDGRIAECFLLDAIQLALVDEQIHSREAAWLKAVALANGFAEEWLESESRHIQAKEGPLDHADVLNIRQYL